MRNVTVFGGSGFLGRYLISRLVKGGDRVRAAVRDPAAASHLLPLGDVGQVQPVQANIRNAASVRRAVGGADVVVNLVGLLYQRGAQSFQAVHEDGAATIAAVAAEAGASRLLQVSAIGAAADATSAYGRSKAAGEAAVREHFPGATIVRPSIVFGPEDGFFNLFGMLASLSPVLPLIGGGHTRFQPVYVGDVADGIDALSRDPASAGATYEFGGGQVYSFRELMEMVCAQTGRQRFLVPVPFALVKFDAAFLQLWPRPLLTMDQVELLKRDNVADGNCPGLDDLGIAPTPLEAVLPTYMHRYRRAGRLQPTEQA